MCIIRCVAMQTLWSFSSGNLVRRIYVRSARLFSLCCCMTRSQSVGKLIKPHPPPPCWASPRAKLSGTGTPLRWAYHFIHRTPLTSSRSGNSDVSLDRSGFGRSSLSSLYSYVLVGGACCGASWYLYRLAMGSQGALLAATCDWPLIA